MIYRNIYSLIFLTLIASYVQAQKIGCTDPLANNYDENSTYNDGSCQYNKSTISFNDEKKLPSSLNEISGMVYWQGKIYAHQDSGGPNKIFEVEPSSGKVTKTIVLEGATNVDWEDITQDETSFYVADVGNNVSGNREDLKIYKFPKSAITNESNVIIPNSEIEIIHFKYEDQTDFTNKGNNNTAFDCEAVAYNRGKLHLFTKNWIGETTTHYTIPIVAGDYIAKKRESINVGKLKITGADFGAYDELVLVGYEVTGFANTAIYLDFGFDGTYYYLNTGNFRRLDIGSAILYGQIEGVSMKNALEGYISNENFRKIFFNVPQKIKKFSISKFIKDYYKNNPLDLNKLSTPEAGTIRYNAYTDKVEGFDGTHWTPFS